MNNELMNYFTFSFEDKYKDKLLPLVTYLSTYNLHGGGGLPQKLCKKRTYDRKNVRFNLI